MTTKNLLQAGQTRREFCARACRFASVAAGGALVAACGGAGGSVDAGTPLPSLTAARTNGVLTLTIDANSALANVGGMALVNSPSGSFLVSRTSQDACTVLTAVCTHASCTVSGMENGIYVCPCHGSEYDPAGHVVRGPASSPLQTFSSQLSNGVLTISS
jgi:cytochrome b6-f complex iron-sulfur subunit